jgi:four helix bundle protein
LIKFLNSLPRNNVNLVISNQVLRSGTSIGANLTEASSSSSRLEFKRFNEIALKSANETFYWLELIRDSSIDIDFKRLESLLSELGEISKMIASGVIKLKGKK